MDATAWDTWWRSGGAVSIAADGSVYITGSTEGNLNGQTNSGGSDAFLTKYSSSGSNLWTQLIGTSSDDYGQSVSTAADGSVYITGSTKGNLNGQTNNGGYDAYLAKYSSDGSNLWTQLIGTSSDDYGFSVSTAADGSVYITGNTNGSLDGQIGYLHSSDAFLTKYNSDGSKVWTEILGSPGGEWGLSASTTDDGSVYITGFTTTNLDGQTNNGADDAFLAKYNSDSSTETAINNSTLIATSKSIFNTSINGESFSYYIHPGGDITGVGFDGSRNSINQQTVSSSAYESYVVSLFDQIDAVIDLDFMRQINNNGSTVDIYAVADDGTNMVGATYFWNNYFDIDFEVTGDNAKNQNVIVHEIGHALGLDHPFDDRFDSRYTVDDTVMSYNIGSSGWTTYFREADLTVLKNIWGVENDLVNTGGGGGGGGGGSTTPLTSPVPTPATTPTPSTEVPTQGSTSSAIPVTTTQQSSPNSPVLGIQPQAAVSSIKLDTPLIVGTLQLTQAVVGTVGSDVITGSDAAEVLAGGQGKDKISGGAGADGFLFEQPGEFGKQKRDTITDFNPDEGDKVMISREAFDGVGKVKLKVVTGKKNAKKMLIQRSRLLSMTIKKVCSTSTRISTKMAGAM